MLIDTDVLIWLFRGRASAHNAIEQLDSVQLSAVTYMEMVQGMRNNEEFRLFRRTIHDHQWIIIPLNENISHRACVYIENHALSHGLTIADSLIAASAIESGLPLMSANVRHYRVITELTLSTFRP